MLQRLAPNVIIIIVIINILIDSLNQNYDDL